MGRDAFLSTMTGSYYPGTLGICWCSYALWSYSPTLSNTPSAYAAPPREHTGVGENSGGLLWVEHPPAWVYSELHQRFSWLKSSEPRKADRGREGGIGCRRCSCCQCRRREGPDPLSFPPRSPPPAIAFCHPPPLPPPPPADFQMLEISNRPLRLRARVGDGGREWRRLADRGQVALLERRGEGGALRLLAGRGAPCWGEGGLPPRVCV